MWTLEPSLCLLVCVLMWASPCCGEPLNSDAGRPTRPKSFQSADDLRTYLDQLGLYYAVAGRPRFGKRMAFNPHNIGVSRSPVPEENHYFMADNNDKFYDRFYEYSSQDE